MNTPVILASLLNLAPPTEIDAPVYSTADVVIAEESVQVTTFDSHGTETAEIIQWIDGDGDLHVDSNFADGLYCETVIDASSRTVVVARCDDPNEAAARIAVVGEILDRTRKPHAIDAGWACAGELVLTAAACAGGHVIGCVLGSVAMACACIEAMTTDGCFE